MLAVPVLTFHALAPTRHATAWPRDDFEALVARWAASGRAPIGIDAFGELLRRGSPANDAWMATFDDGYASFVDAHAACRRAGGRAVLFLSTSLLGRSPIFPGDSRCPDQAALAESDVAALARDGCDVMSHADAHVDLRTLGDDEIDASLKRARERIADLVGRPPSAFAYPFGKSDARVRRRVAAVHGMAFGTRLEFVRAGDDVHDLPRLDAHYLRSFARHGAIDDPEVRRYLRMRGWLRRIRGWIPFGVRP